jgi:polyhydroxybutyrate depolymerase
VGTAILLSAMIAGSVAVFWTPGCGSTVSESGGEGGADARAIGHDAGTDVGRSARDTGAADQSTRDAVMATDDAAGDAGPCGTRTGMRGLTHRTMTVAGLKRTYLIYLPTALDPTTPIPFVFVHHGYTMSGQEMYAITDYSALADSEGIGVAFPDGETGPDSLGAPWNVGTDVCPSTLGPPPEATGNDFAFLDAMEADVSQDQCLDSAHIFLTGFSMGGYFAHQTGCMRPDIRAVAPHSGGTHDLSTCVSTHKPIIIFHGDSDLVIPYGCDVPDASDIPSGFTPSATAWAARNGCGTGVTTVPVENGTCSYYEGCPSDGQVALCVFSGMGHCWAGGSADGGVFSCPDYAAATQLEWAFFKKYAW